MRHSITVFISLFLFSCSSPENITDPTPVQYTLSISSGTGGTVSTSGGTYEEGSTVNVTATPNSGYIFQNWSNGSTDNPLTVTVNQNITLTANFIKRKYPLTINIQGEGTVSEEIVSSGNSAPTEYNSGTVLRLTAVADDGWTFNQWSGDVSGTEESIEITLNQPKNITVDFNSLVRLPIINQNSNVFPSNTDINWNDHAKNGNSPYYFDDDNIPDIITGIRPMGTSGDPNVINDLVVFNYNGNEVFRFDVKSFNPQIRDSLNVLNIAFADVNNDSKLDFGLQYMGEWSGEDPSNSDDNIYIGQNVYLLISNSSGSYDISEVIDDPEDVSFEIKIWDFDFDGDIDILPGSMDNGVILENQGNNIFERTSITPLYTSSSGIVKILDWDNDGEKDYVTISRPPAEPPHNPELAVILNNVVQKIQLNNTGYNFNYNVEGNSSSWSMERMAIIDGDNDGDWDLILGGFYDDSNGIRFHEQKYFQNNNGSFSYIENYIEHDYTLDPVNPRPALNNMLQVWVEDLDGDGDEDFYYPKYGEFGGAESVFWWENTGNGFIINKDFYLPFN